MKKYDVKNIRTIAVMGHHGSGKTSFMESVLYDGFEVKRKDHSASNTTNQSVEGVLLNEQKGIAEFMELLNN